MQKERKRNRLLIAILLIIILILISLVGFFIYNDYYLKDNTGTTTNNNTEKVEIKLSSTLGKEIKNKFDNAMNEIFENLTYLEPDKIERIEKTFDNKNESYKIYTSSPFSFYTISKDLKTITLTDDPEGYVYEGVWNIRESLMFVEAKDFILNKELDKIELSEPYSPRYNFIIMGKDILIFFVFEMSNDDIIESIDNEKNINSLYAAYVVDFKTNIYRKL